MTVELKNVVSIYILAFYFWFVKRNLTSKEVSVMATKKYKYVAYITTKSGKRIYAKDYGYKAFRIEA